MSSSMSPHKHKKFFDVVVVGGGLVGACVAAGLKQHRLTASLNVALIDAAQLQGPSSSSLPSKVSLPPEPPLRVSTVTPASRALLTAVGAWDILLNLQNDNTSSVAPFHAMKVWDANNASINYTSQDAFQAGAIPTPDEPMAHVVENDALQQAMLQVATNRGVHALWPRKLTSLTLPKHDVPRSNEPAQLTLLDESTGKSETISTSLVVAADGQRSRTRQLAKLRYEGGPYRDQVGAVFTLALDEPIDTAYQKFLPTGPLALLPVRAALPSGAPRANVVWSTTAAHAAELCSLDGDALAAATNGALEGGPAPRAIEAVGVARSFPLSMSMAPRMTAPRLVLAGDAARAVHPLAGQGANLGFADARAAVETIASCARSGLDLGDGASWQRYGDLRLAEGMAWSASLELIRRAYASEALSGARFMGVSVMDQVSPVKSLLVRVASGVSGAYGGALDDDEWGTAPMSRK
ncbi:hypothetical protein PPROV_000587800 [Pycnococcus provasolii]|uniref:FAD-binding domain-containing protein n=1 Tax=Pycnococcus provasolii TaxID=41880 RepID=A0A830HKB3_9CHLO|nr:hypothetical protein PPROV_000587800 [Pycnococcus provasolii]